MGRGCCAGERAPVIFIEKQRFTRTKANLLTHFLPRTRLYQIMCMVEALCVVSACYITGRQFVLVGPSFVIIIYKIRTAREERSGANPENSLSGG